MPLMPQKELTECNIKTCHTIYLDKWVFPKIGVPQNGWFIIENSIKMYDLGGKPTIFGNTQMTPFPRLLGASNISISLSGQADYGKPLTKDKKDLQFRGT